jgi:4-oxalomesaconate hydratase
MIEEGKRVLVFSAHAADFCSRAGGAIIRFAEVDGEVLVYDLTYGEKCESPALWARDPKPTVEEVKAIRKQEAEEAATLLGAEISFLDYGDSPLVLGPERRLEILDRVRAFRPDLVLSHWIDDILHPDHAETTQAVLWACSYCNAGGIDTGNAPCPRPRLICYETTMGTAPVSGYVPDLYVDISEVFERKIEALEKLAAQPLLSEVYKVLNRYRGIEAQHVAGMTGCQYAEGYARIGKQPVA